MVARIDNQTFALRTPETDPFDSDDVVLALETARALETRGDIRDAARWLRRAADQARKDGHDDRVLALARAAADLTNALGGSSSRQTLPDAKSAGHGANVAKGVPTPSKASSSSPLAPRSLSVPAAPARPTGRAVDPPTSATSPAETVTMRVAVPASMHDPRLFVVRQLAQGQPLPPGTREAILVLKQ